MGRREKRPGTEGQGRSGRWAVVRVGQSPERQVTEQPAALASGNVVLPVWVTQRKVRRVWGKAGHDQMGAEGLSSAGELAKTLS